MYVNMQALRDPHIQLVWLANEICCPDLQACRRQGAWGVGLGARARWRREKRFV